MQAASRTGVAADAQDRPHQLPAGDQRDRATDQSPHRAELHPPPPADVACRSGTPVGPAAQHRVGHRRSADRRRLGHRRRRRALAARTASAQPAPERRARRHSRRRAAARDDDDRAGRRRRALHGAGDISDGRRRPNSSSRIWRTPPTQLRRAHPRVLCEGMGVSLPGRVDDSGRLVFAPNLGWGPVQITQMIEAAVGLPVNVENAANACALAELWFGRHPEHIRHIVAVTVSEGIGVGLLLNGQLVHGAGSMAGEFGHVSLDDAGPPCRCGRRGCWERYASNSAAVQHYLELRRPGAAAGRARRCASRIWRGGRTAATRRPVASLDRMGRYLGHGAGQPGDGPGARRHRRRRRGHGHLGSHRPARRRADGARARCPTSPTRVVATDPKAQPRLRGAVTLVVQQHFGAPVVA